MASSTNTNMPPDQPRQGFGHPHARFAAVDARFNKLAENQQEIALTLARLVALLEAGENQ